MIDEMDCNKEMKLLNYLNACYEKIPSISWNLDDKQPGTVGD